MLPQASAASGRKKRAEMCSGPLAKLTNRLLCAMPDDVLERLAPRLHHVSLRHGQVLFQVDAPVTHVYFVNRGLVSLIKSMQDGRTVEIGAIGAEGLAGVSALFNLDHALFETVIQLSGDAYRISVPDLRWAMAEEPKLRALLEGYVHVVVSQLAQTAACNRLHSLEQRCCRWLLACHDGAHGDDFHLTHEFLAMMLGARRVSVSIAAGALQRAGLITYKRGRVTVVNRAGLEAASCECYDSVRNQVEKLFAATATLSP